MTEIYFEVGDALQRLLARKKNMKVSLKPELLAHAKRRIGIVFVSILQAIFLKGQSLP